MDKGRIVTVARFDSQGKAALMQGLLESAGIECSLMHDTIQSILPLGNEMTQIELCVAEEDEARARELLAAKFDKSDFEAQAKPAVKEKRSCGCIKRK